VYDVMVDLRKGSPTYKQWAGVELTAANRLMLYIPEHCAHGYLTLEDDSEVLYFVSEVYAPGCERGLRYNDPAIGIKWPRSVEVVSEKDATWPLCTA
jgi:dTDP-4-dehydrorhamnose 3,5-epimerase